MRALWMPICTQTYTEQENIYKSLVSDITSDALREEVILCISVHKT